MNNLSTSDCLLDAETECKTNPAGNGYRGTKSVSAFNHNCLRWTEVEDDKVTAGLAVDDVAKAKTYCRMLQESLWESPSCVINGTKNTQVQEKCEINHCGKFDCMSM